MALFKISKGLNTNLPTTITEGYCWYTYDDSKFYIDYKDEKGVLTRKALNAKDAETLTGASLETILNSSNLEIPTSKAVLDALANKADKTTTVNGHALNGNVTVTKSDIGLGNVENKSSTTIRGELTKANVTDALGYTPLDADDAYEHPTSHPASMITGLAGVATSGSYNDLSDKPTIPATYTHPTTTGNKHIPAGGASGQILRWSADGTAVWGADNNTTYDVATQGAHGLMSKEDKTKLDGVATGATKVTTDTVSGWGYTKNAGTVTSVKVGSTSYNPSSGVVSLPAYPTVPTKTSDLTNDSGYLTQHQDISGKADKTELENYIPNDVTDLDLCYDEIQNLIQDEYGIYWNDQFALYEGTSVEANGTVQHRVPIVPGENVTFTKTDDNMAFVINVTTTQGEKGDKGDAGASIVGATITAV